MAVDNSSLHRETYSQFSINWSSVMDVVIKEWSSGVCNYDDENVETGTRVCEEA